MTSIALALALLVPVGPVAAQPGAIWERTVVGFGGGFDGANAVAVDGQGNVVAAGTTQYAGADLDFTVTKSSPDGSLLWQQHINGTANGFDIANAVAVDRQGNIAAAGRTANTGTGSDFKMASFDPTGKILWQHAANGTANDFDEALAVAVDGAGAVVAAGSTTNPGTGMDFTVIKIGITQSDGNISGISFWQKELNGTADGFDTASSVAVDGQGDVVAAGLLRNSGTGADFTVVKFSTGGFPLWLRALNGTANGEDFASSVAVDGQGHAIAAGYTTNLGSDQDFTVALFHPDGAPLWERVLDDTVSRDDLALAVAVDGLPLWQRTLHGTTDSRDDAITVEVDRQGNVVAGGTRDLGRGDELAVVKLNPDGALLWERALPRTGDGSGFAYSVAVDGQGNVVAAGNNSGKFTVVKFNR